MTFLPNCLICLLCLLIQKLCTPLPLIFLVALCFQFWTAMREEKETITSSAVAADYCLYFVPISHVRYDDDLSKAETDSHNNWSFRWVSIKTTESPLRFDRQAVLACSPSFPSVLITFRNDLGCCFSLQSLHFSNVSIAFHGYNWRQHIVGRIGNRAFPLINSATPQ